MEVAVVNKLSCVCVCVYVCMYVCVYVCVCIVIYNNGYYLPCLFSIGSIMDAGMEYKVSKHSDLATLKVTLNTVIGAHYPSLMGHVAVRMIPCPGICTQTLSLFVR